MKVEDAVPDRALAERWKTGDTQAFENLVARHSEEIFRLGLQILRNRHDAEEICQDAFLRAHQNVRRFDPALGFRTWIYTIARRLILNRVRDRKVETRALSEWSTGAGPLRLPDAGDLAPCVERLDEVLHRLNPEDRLLLHCRFREGMKFSEIAEIVESTEEAVRVRFFRLLRRVRAEFSRA